MPTPYLRGRRDGAEIRLLDPTATEADEVVMVAWVAAEVRRRALAGELADEAVAAEQLERPVDRGQSEAGVVAPRIVVELDDGKAAGPAGNRLE